MVIVYFLGTIIIVFKRSLPLNIPGPKPAGVRLVRNNSNNDKLYPVKY